MSRALSYTEISTAHTCQARWAFAYGGQLTGGMALRRRATAAILSNGRAWGAAVASWHASGPRPGVLDRLAAHEALRASYAADIAEQAERKVHVSPEKEVLYLDGLDRTLSHYMAVARPLGNLTRREGELNTPIPSRTGRRPSSLYRFEGYIDGFNVDDRGSEWIVEFKLRDQLTPAHVIQNSRQIRDYAWARQQETNRPVVGAIVEERLTKFPQPPRLVQARRKNEGIDGLVPSHAVDQVTTPDLYIEICREYDVDPVPDTVAAFEARRWDQRIPIDFLPGELEEVGRELVSSAKLIRDLDSGELYPVRNTQPMLCNGCKFREICPNPEDEFFVDTIFERVPPKKLRALTDVTAPSEAVAA